VLEGNPKPLGYSNTVQGGILPRPVG
jgi:hypothetical protein